MITLKGVRELSFVLSWLKWFVNQISWPTVITSLFLSGIVAAPKIIKSHKSNNRKGKRIVADLPAKLNKLEKRYQKDGLRIASKNNLMGHSSSTVHLSMQEEAYRDYLEERNRLFEEAKRELEDLGQHGLISEIQRLNDNYPPTQPSTAIERLRKELPSKNE